MCGGGGGGGGGGEGGPGPPPPKFFRPLGPHFGLKIRGGSAPPLDSPLDITLRQTHIANPKGACLKERIKCINT